MNVSSERTRGKVRPAKIELWEIPTRHRGHVALKARLAKIRSPALILFDPQREDPFVWPLSTLRSVYLACSVILYSDSPS